MINKQTNTIESSLELIRIASEPNRFKILNILSKELICACKLANTVGIPQNLVSHHLKVLLKAEILDRRREGNNLYYYINPLKKEQIIKLFELINIK